MPHALRTVFRIWKGKHLLCGELCDTVRVGETWEEGHAEIKGVLACASSSRLVARSIDPVVATLLIFAVDCCDAYTD